MKKVKINNKLIALLVTGTMVVSGSALLNRNNTDTNNIISNNIDYAYANELETVTTKTIINVEYNQEQGTKTITYEVTVTRGLQNETHIETETVPMELSDYETKEVITKTDLNIRKEPNTDSEIITTVGENTHLDSINLVGDWYEIIYNGEKAYVKAEYTYEAVEKDGFRKQTMNYQIGDLEMAATNYVEATTSVNIRSDATADSNKLGLLNEGQKLEVVRLLTNGWFEVKYNNTLAYVNADFVREITEEKILTPFNKIVMFENDSEVYDNKDRSTVIDYVPTYEIAFVYGEEDDMYLAQVNNRLSYINKSDVSDLDEKVVIVDLSDQNAKLYDGNNVIIDTPVVSGKPSTPSDIGYFDIDLKQQGATLEGPGYSSYVDYWMPYNGGEGLHDAEYHTDYDENGNAIKSHGWRSADDFGGDIHEYAGSHGCINLPNESAHIIYDNVEVGTKVLIKK